MSLDKLYLWMAYSHLGTSEHYKRLHSARYCTALRKENVMKSRIPVGLVMMLAALLMSFIPAATISTQPAAALSSCDWAQFVADVTVPDGTSYAPGTTFTKTWRLKNIGSCTWTT